MAETSNQSCYLLDTSVILDDPIHIVRLNDNNENAVLITDIVLAELNNKKDDMRGDAGFRAREFFRLADNENGEPIEFSDLPECLRSNATIDRASCEDKYYRLSMHFPHELLQEEQVGTDIPVYIIYRETYHIEKHYSHVLGLNAVSYTHLRAHET